LSTPKEEWKSTIHSMKRASFILTEPAESAPFRSSLFPPSLLHAEADLKTKKAFKEAVLRMDAAGACGELAHATLGKESPIIKRMKDACTGESPQEVDSLLTVLRDSLGELNSVKKEISKAISKIAAGVFNQGIEDQIHLVCDSPAAKAVKSTLELCKPSLTHLFGDDDSRLDKALEAAKFSHFQTTPYRSKAPYFCSSVYQEGQDRKKKPYRKPSKSPYKPRSLGKANGPASKKGEGQLKK
jgi:hypothetical protein